MSHPVVVLILERVKESDLLTVIHFDSRGQLAVFAMEEISIRFVFVVSSPDMHIPLLWSDGISPVNRPNEFPVSSQALGTFPCVVSVSFTGEHIDNVLAVFVIFGFKIESDSRSAIFWILKNSRVVILNPKLLTSTSFKSSSRVGVLVDQS